jgi:hypothetical protein
MYKDKDGNIIDKDKVVTEKEGRIFGNSLTLPLHIIFSLCNFR